ncbi:hypothetical protein [Spiroplasma tabanidicola]|uniref:hypothetical protein n=1 Tax=Spiroplasma tabanidicola TaxID=324079 RepID=UPI0012DF1065|nr:hypothetical protein [Spiroplasma tabanidicola]
MKKTLLKINNKKFYHFFEKRKQQVKFAYKNKSNEMILFLSNSIRSKIFMFLKELVEESFNIKVFAIAYNKKTNSNFVFIRCEKPINIVDKNKIERLINLIIKNSFNMTVNIVLADYYQLYKGNSVVDERYLKNLIRNCLTTKETQFSLPISKNKREKLYKVFLGYNNITWKSVDTSAGKIIKISFKVAK